MSTMTSWYSDAANVAGRVTNTVDATLKAISTRDECTLPGLTPGAIDVEQLYRANCPSMHFWPFYQRAFGRLAP